MADPLQPVSAGDRLAIRAPTWNAILDSARNHRQGSREADIPVDRLRTGGIVEAFALNSTGAALDAYKPAGVTAVGGCDTVNYPDEWQQSPLLTLTAPTGATSFVAVTLEAIPAGQIGRVAIAGVVLCDCEIVTGGFANPAAADTTRLHTAATGTIRVLYIPAGAGSTKRCVVSLDSQIPAPAAAALDMQNTDGTQHTAAATGIKTDKSSGVGMTLSAGVETIAGIDASFTQKGVISLASQYLGQGSKAIYLGHLAVQNPVNREDASARTSTDKTNGRDALFSIYSDASFVVDYRICGTAPSAVSDQLGYICHISYANNYSRFGTVFSTPGHSYNTLPGPGVDWSTVFPQSGAVAGTHELDSAGLERSFQIGVGSNASGSGDRTQYALVSDGTLYLGWRGTVTIGTIKFYFAGGIIYQVDVSGAPQALGTNV